MPESIEALLRALTGEAAYPNDSVVQIYARYAGFVVNGDDSLYRLVCRKLTANGKGAQIRESLEATLLAGGAVGTSIEEVLLKTGLTGWS